MDDRDRIRPHSDFDELDDTEEDVEVWPAGLLASYGTGGDTSTGNAGALASGLAGGAQARKLTEAQEAEEGMPVHVPVAPEVYGYGRRQTADEGVSPQQNEAESDELNG
jgi:hypothetical protein